MPSPLPSVGVSGSGVTFIASFAHRDRTAFPAATGTDQRHMLIQPGTAGNDARYRHVRRYRADSPRQFTASTPRGSICRDSDAV